jgi:2',3'-cyclic-nucleotide 2'-phosphodiesterase (5'-nucleotidase family)
MKKLQPLGLLLLLFVVESCAVKVPQQRIPQAIDFIILQINDVYEIAPLEGGNAGGLARVASIRKELLKETPNVVTVIAGDFLSPSLTANLKLETGEKIAGLQMIETLNAMGLDYATFGNHEFDERDSALVQKRFNQCTFRFVSANVRRVYTGGAIAPFKQTVKGKTELVPDFIKHTFKNSAGDSMKLAFTGVLLPFTKRPYVHYLPVEENFRRVVAQAKTQSDVVVALTHLAAADDRALAAAVPGVPLFIGGHDHDHQDHYVENTIITKADANAKTVYIHRCRFDPNSKLVRIQSSLKYVNASIPSDPATEAVVNKWVSKVDQTLRNNGYQPEQKIATLREPLECKETDIRSRQTNFGAMTTQAMEYAMPGADAYLINSGSMRMDDNLAGTMTVYDVVRSFPFGGGFARQEIPGSELKNLLDNGLKKNKTEGGYLQVSHISEVNGAWQINGKPIDDKQIYKVVISSFVAAGSEANLGFMGKYKADEPKTLTTTKGKQIKNDVRDVVIEYMTAAY